MKAERPYPKATITEKGARALRSGHPWVYEGEVTSLEPTPGTSPDDARAGEALADRGDDARAAETLAGLGAAASPDEGARATSAPADSPVENGSLVDVVGPKGTYLGTGLLSLKSRIRVRLVTRNANDTFGPAFWERKVRWAWEYRKAVMGEDISACRLIFSEADEFPGLIVDRFGDVLVAEVLSVGMERHKDLVFSALVRVLAEDGVRLRGIYERNDVAVRELEGLPQEKGWWMPAESTVAAGVSGSVATGSSDRPAAGLASLPPMDPGAAPLPADPGPTETQIVENGVRYHVDFENGQKTGFFLDQKYNRRAVARIARGRRVLDCCTHTGSFALNAALGGAEFVRAVDVSAQAIEMARANAQLNGSDVASRMDFTVANVFDLLPQVEEERNPERFDLIVLDPPAFTKSRKTIRSAERGYREINYRAMRILPRGGYLVTCSCSHFMDPERFRRMLADAARDAGVTLRQVEERQQAPDHPIVWGVPETDYLKCLIFQVV